MSVKEDKIVMPGDKIGIIEQYLPGEGTYDDNGDIKSSVLGNVKINQKMKVISVELRFLIDKYLERGEWN